MAQKQVKKLSKFSFSKIQMVAVAVFVLGFGGWGVYKLTASHAAVPADGSNGTVNAPLAVSITKICRVRTTSSTVYDQMNVYQSDNGSAIASHSVYGVNSSGNHLLSTMNGYIVGNINNIGGSMGYYPKYFVRTNGTNGLHSDSTQVSGTTTTYC